MNLEIQGGTVDPVIRPVRGDERLAEITEGRLTGLSDVLLAHQDPHPLAVLPPAQGTDSLIVAAEAPLRLLGQLDLGDEGAG